MTSAAVGPLCNPCNNPQQHQGHPSFAAPRQPPLHPPSHSSHSHPLFQALWEGHTGSQAVQPSSALELGPGGENEGIEGGQGSFSATHNLVLRGCSHPPLHPGTGLSPCLPKLFQIPPSCCSCSPVKNKALLNPSILSSSLLSVGSKNFRGMKKKI